MAEEIKVSVLCYTYNHEPYIRSALDGFVMQKTNFKYEVLVHDDASTDNTAKIILEYAEKYPDIIKPQIEAENKYQRHIPFDTWKYVQGKYVAFCEGDDYWTDEYKLQKQFDAMEQNPDATLCIHKVRSVFENTDIPDEMYPPFELKSQKLSSYEFMKLCSGLYCFQTSSHFMRHDMYNEYKLHKPEYATLVNGDEGILLYSAKCGNIIYINDEMSIYRRNTPTSWSVSAGKRSNEQITEGYKKLIKAFELYDEFSEHKFSDILKIRIDRAKYLTLVSEGKFKEAVKTYPKYVFENKKSGISIIIKAYLPKLYDLFKRRGKI